jgi:CheY-like chemotaxis protein
MVGSLILVVEDNPITEKVVRIALEAEGYTVATAPDGRTALRLVEDRCPDLILQDLLLPDTTGFELISRLRSRSGCEAIPILAFSGFATALDEARQSAGAFDDFIAKPIEPSRLADIVKGYLPRPAGSANRFGAGRRVLLADDDPAQLKLIGIRLDRAGFDVMTAMDGVEALERARAFRPDVIVADVLMPGLDGYGLCLAAREDSRLAHVPVILVTTSYVEEADRELGRRAGADRFVVRSPDLGEVIDALRDCLAGPPSVPPQPADAAGDLDQDRAERAARQLERQTALHAGAVQRCATLAAELSILRGISEALSREGDLGTALDEALATSLGAGGISRGALYLCTPDGRFSLSGQAGFASGARLADLFGHAELLSRATDVGALVFPSEPSGRSLLDEAGATSLLLAPILCRGERLGALLFASDDKDLSDSDSLSFAMAIAGQFGHALALARAFERVSANEALLRALLRSMDDTRERVG